MYGRIVVAAHKDFDDQRIMQNTMVRLKKDSPGATVVCGANRLDKQAGLIWKALGGHTIVEEPDFTRGLSRKDAMKARDRRVLTHQIDLCISFEIHGRKGWLALLCQQKNIPLYSVDSEYQIVDAD